MLREPGQTSATSCNIQNVARKIWPFLKLIQHVATYHNISRQGGQTYATCCVEMLRAFVQAFKEHPFISNSRERDRAYQQAAGPAFSPQRTDGPRFTGGGFNLKPPAKAVAWKLLNNYFVNSPNISSVYNILTINFRNERLILVEWMFYTCFCNKDPHLLNRRGLPPLKMTRNERVLIL